MRSFTSFQAQRRRERVRRRRQAGAAFVESLIVISMILLFLFAVLWMKDLYTAKLQTIEYARADAWVDALNGCPGKPEHSAEVGVQAKSAVALSKNGGPEGNGDDTSGDSGGLRSNANGDDAPDWFALREGGSSTQSVDGFKSFTDGTDMKLATTRKYHCNERGDPKELHVDVKDLSGDLASMIADLIN
jgi:hypothetical protein